MLCTCTKFFVLNDFVYVQPVIKLPNSIMPTITLMSMIVFFLLLVLNGS